jgi:hypothetical protein
MTYPTGSFPPLSGEYVEEIVSVYQQGIRETYGNQRKVYVGTEDYYDNQDQENDLQVSLNYNNVAQYLSDYMDYGNLSVLYSGGIPDVATSTFGLLRGNTGEDRYQFESLPDFNETNPDGTVKYGKFETSGGFQSNQSTSDLSNLKYDTLNYYALTDGTSQPIKLKVSTSHFGIDSLVISTIHNDIDSFGLPNYQNPDTSIDTSTSGSSPFNPDPFANDRFPSGPSDGYTPENPDDEEGSDSDSEESNDDDDSFQFYPPPQSHTLFIS